MRSYINYWLNFKSKKKVEDLISILNGLTIATKLLDSMKDHVPEFK